jgi:hypothetical protein
MGHAQRVTWNMEQCPGPYTQGGLGHVEGTTPLLKRKFKVR